MTAYADGEAAPAESRGLEMHLESCSACRARLKVERALKKAVSGAGARAMPGDLKAELLRRARRAAPAREPGWLAWRWPVGLGLGAAFAAASGLIFVRSMPEETLAVETLLAAHRQYELTMPAAPSVELAAGLPERLAEADDAR